MADKEVDEAFAQIVAHWDDEATPVARDSTEPGTADDVEPKAEERRPRHAKPSASGIESSDVLTPPADPDGLVDSPSTIDREPLPENEIAPWPVWRGALPPDEDVLAAIDDDESDHFEPGPLAPLPPQEDLHFWGIVVGLVAGPLLLLWLVIFRPDVSGWWTILALLLSVGGFALLVLRQPKHRDEDDPDNGARL